jgi:hypothetical protein
MAEPSPQERLDLDRILTSVPWVPAAVVILIGADGSLTTATKGIDNDKALFEVCWSMALQLAESVYDEMSADTKRQLAIVLPTREDAERLGILRSPDDVPRM